ncbi:hypothetical protein [Kribbella sp. NBC_00359]|uniref:hypothetical protein n=1 Tax=Kribbella sp. NBC_00359 TaxID=2975966 RepID=UPI002E1BC12D
MLKIIRASSCVLFAAVSILLIPQYASAAPPATPTLTPAPPDFLTCKAVGAGTICQGTRTLTITSEDTGITCGSGSSAFTILDSSTLDQRAVRYYDTNGNLTRRIIHDHYRGQWFNPGSGREAPYIQNNNTIDDLAIPGDFTSSTQSFTGEVIMRAGPGAPVLIAVGRQVFNSDGELLSSAGRNAFVAAFVEGDPTVFNAVCAALA